ncbi:D-isomer specific 2-hydroxyacid dehydrogenase family protein [Williamsia sterculiae]|uniref:Phosphoglycerate dehydrogenase n=1 Tax=Williamsia sterculiae TaxID=1344003 RepID=A0A1N7GJC0_9NOCA|nr:D-isomer specific 2-hydroxyacid dehydrogenase family protein [Williamsia sterculiae]SIS12703.1 Phosphoglycerate dehydrogenase [Williamsia sterculiae]
MTGTPIALLPERDEHVERAIVDGGATVVDDLAAATGLIWLGGLDDFPNSLPDNVQWVQLKLAGIEAFVDAGVIDDRRVWTNASGFYAENVAEHALALLLSVLHQIPAAVTRRWDKDGIDPAMRSLQGATVAIVGAGGIARALIPRLQACGASVIAVNRSGRPVDGAAQTLPAERLSEVWPRCDHVVLAAPATAETRHLVDASVLEQLPAHAWVINVARGSLIDQDALISALDAGSIAGAALDVTDPEPPADDDPLWDRSDVIITPHVANPASGLHATMAPWVRENVRRFIAGEPLLARLEPGRDY